MHLRNNLFCKSPALVRLDVGKGTEEDLKKLFENAGSVGDKLSGKDGAQFLNLKPLDFELETDPGDGPVPFSFDLRFLDFDLPSALVGHLDFDIRPPAIRPVPKSSGTPRPPSCLDKAAPATYYPHPRRRNQPIDLEVSDAGPRVPKRMAPEEGR